jgi:hypothetical protein
MVIDSVKQIIYGYTLRDFEYPYAVKITLKFYIVFAYNSVLSS